MPDMHDGAGPPHHDDGYSSDLESLREEFRRAGRAPSPRHPDAPPSHDDAAHHGGHDEGASHERHPMSRDAALILSLLASTEPFGSPGLYDLTPEAIEQMLDELAAGGVITPEPVVTLSRKQDLRNLGSIAAPGRLRTAAHIACCVDLYPVVHGHHPDTALAIRRDRVAEVRLGGWWPGSKHYEAVAVALVTTGPITTRRGESRQRPAFESHGGSLRPTRALLEVVERSQITKASVQRLIGPPSPEFPRRAPIVVEVLSDEYYREKAKAARDAAEAEHRLLVAERDALAAKETKRQGNREMEAPNPQKLKADAHELRRANDHARQAALADAEEQAGAEPIGVGRPFELGSPPAIDTNVPFVEIELPNPPAAPPRPEELPSAPDPALGAGEAFGGRRGKET